MGLWLGVGVPLLDRVFRVGLVREVATVMFLYGQVGGGVLAAGLANRALFALLPGLLLAVSVIGFVARDPEVQAALVKAIGELIPPVQQLLESTLAVLAAGAVGSTIVGLIALAWAASGFFKALDVTMAVILETERRRDPILRGIMSLIAVSVVLGVMVIAIVLILLAWRVADEDLSSMLPPLIFRLGSIVGFWAALTVLLGAAYRWVPTEAPPWRLHPGPGSTRRARAGSHHPAVLDHRAVRRRDRLAVRRDRRRVHAADLAPAVDEPRRPGRRVGARPVGWRARSIADPVADRDTAPTG